MSSLATPVRRALPEATGAVLAVVPPRRTRASTGAFVLLLMVLLTAGFVALLALNTALARSSFTVDRLTSQQSALLQQEQELRQEVARLQSPGHLATAAYALGMLPGDEPSFLRVGFPPEAR